MKVSKKAIAFVLCLIMLAGTVAIGGDGFSSLFRSLNVTAGAVSVSDLTYAVDVEENSVTITGCSLSASGELVIPDEIDGNTVTVIGEQAFENCTSITSAVLPGSIETIKAYAFSGCTGLESVIIPDGVYDIGKAAFKNCSSLTGAVLPDSLDYSLSDNAFEGCSALESVTIPNSINYIGVQSFDGCSSLHTVIFEGTETEFNKIWIAAGNTSFENADVQYGSDGHTHNYRRYYDDNGIYVDYCIICGKTKKNVYTEGTYKNKSKKGSIESAYSKSYNTAVNGTTQWFSKIRLTSLNDNKVRITAICRNSDGNKVTTTHYGVFVSKNKQLLEQALNKSLTKGLDSSPNQYDDIDAVYKSHKDEILKIYRKEEADDSLLNIFINGENGSSNEVGDTSLLDPGSKYYYVMFYWKTTGRLRVASKLNWFKTNQAHAGKYSKINGTNGVYSGTNGAYKVGDFCTVQTRNISTSHATIRAEIAKTYNNCLTNVGGTGFYLSKKESDVKNKVESAHRYNNIKNQEDVMIDGSAVVEIWYSIGGADGSKIAPYSYNGYTFKGKDLTDFYGKLECNTKYYWRIYYYTGSNRNSNRKYSDVNWFITDDHIPKVDWETVTPPTCTEPGRAVKKCVACGKVLEERVIPPLDHLWGDWTDTGLGTHEKVCARDISHIQTDIHNWVESTRTDPIPPDQDGEILYTCDACTATYTEPIPVDSVFTPVTVRFLKEDGTLVDTQTGYAGTLMTPPPGPQKEGYTFIGWYSQNNMKAGNTFPTNNTDFTSRYSINSYKITYYADGGSPISVVWVDYNNTIPAEPNTVKTGYTLSGWTYTDESGTPKSITGGISRMPAYNLIAKAKWTPLSLTAHFYIDKDGDRYSYEAVPEIENVPYDSAISMPPKPADSALYTYSDWLPGDGYKMDKLDGKDYYSVATPVNYTATFKDKDGAVMSTATVGYGKAVPFPESLDVTGCTFSGWKRMSDNQILAGLDIGEETMPAHDETYQAVYSPNDYTVTYKLDGAEYFAAPYESAVETVKYNAAVSVRPKAIREGHTVTDWSFTPALVNGKMPAGDVVASAVSSVNSYKVTYKLDGEDYTGEGYNSAFDTVTYNTAVSVRPKAIREGHTVTDWSFSPPLVNGKMPAGDVVASAVSTVNQYTITFRYGSVNNNAVYKTIVQDYGTAITPPADPSFTGYTFIGWDAEIPSAMPAHDITINALWAVRNYTITYKVDGESYDVKQWPYMAKVTPVDTPQKSGYVFSGWTPSEPAVMPAENIVCEGSLLPDTSTKYTVETYIQNLSGEYELYSSSDYYGTTDEPVTADGKYVNPGVGFTLNTESSTMSGVIAGDGSLCLRVYYDRNRYTLTYKFDGEEYFETPYDSAADTHYFGEAVTPRAVPVKEGHSVSAWAFTPALEDGKMPAGNVVANAVSNANAYTLTVGYEMSDGKNELVPTTYTDSVVYGVSYTIPSPAVTGYTPDTAKVEGVMGAEDVTETVIYSPNPHTVTWNVDGKKTVDEYVYGDEIVRPDDPEKEGYTFIGWSEDGETVVDIPDTVPDNDLIFIAVFTKNKYYITWIYDGSSAVSSYYYGDSITVFTPPEKTGYTYSPWSPEVESKMPSHNLEYHCTSSPNPHTVTWNVDGKKTVDEYVYGDEIVRPVDPEKEGYTFEGWSEDGETVVDVAETVPDRDIEYIAVWSVNEYSITFRYGSVNNNAVYETITQDYGTAVAAPADPSFTGYTFTGWDAEIPSAMPAHNITINALWSLNSYSLTVTYTMSDGKDELAPEAYTEQVVYNTGYSVASPEVTGYTPDAAAVEGTMGAGDVAVTVKYSPNAHTVTWNVDGEKTDVDVVYGEEIVKPADPEKEGYTFIGWSEDGETVVDVAETVPDRDIEYIAVWTVNGYSITFKYGEVNDNAVYETVSENFGTEIKKIEDPEVEGYTFLGWDSQIPATMPAENLTVTALWSINEYTVTYKLDGEDYTGEGYNSAFDTVTYNTAVSVRPKAIREGHTVTDWSFTPALVNGKMPAGNVVANATSTIISQNLTVTYVMSDGKNELAPKAYSQAVEYGKDYSVASPDVTGYTPDATVVEGTMGAGDVAVTVKYSPNAHTVTWIVDDEENVVNTVYGNEIVKPEDPTKEGYTFKGWSEDGETVVDVAETVPDKDLTYTAVFEINTYTVTWIVDGSSTVDTYNFGAEIIRPEDPSIAGKVFKGWSGEIPATMPARNLVFEASFDAIMHTATFLMPVENGSYTDETGTYEVVKTVTFEEGQTAIAEPAVPKKDGYVGVWEDYTLGKEDIVIKAIYSITDTDNTDEIETEKTADVNDDGTVTITLNAYSGAQNILVEGENEPLDIVLVVDQSGSMAYYMNVNQNAPIGRRRRDYLVNTAKSFVNSVKQNAEATGADHRISIVGFAMGSEGSGYEYPAYLNTEVLTTVNDRPVSYPNAESAYKKSLMSVTDDYSHILAAINNIDAKGATAADLGFDMAAKVLSENASDRKKVIIFLTDGEPTATDTFDEGVANKAITSSKYLKAQGVTVYSIAISDKANPGDTSSNFNKFLHATSSNYKNASSIWRLAEGSNSGYYLSVRDENALQKIFENIYVRSVAKTLNFGAVTLYDTVKREFTMTVPQEKAFRENMIAKYGITNSDITVDRRDDGTTYIEVRNITPYAYYDSTNIQQGWKADVSFDVTPNENAINAGDYLTNTDEAGVIVGGCTVATFVSPTVSLDGNRCIVEFITGNETYEIREMNIGDEIIAPVCDYATWTISEGTKVSDRVAKYYADLGEKDKTVIWHIGDETVTQTYATGEKITPPEVNVADKVFTGWSPSTEAYMGYNNLEYTALFSEHTHNFKKVSSSGLCTESRKITYTCSCGESYTETLPACEHKLETTVYETGSATITHIFCTECPYSEDNILTFKTAIWGRNTVADLELRNNTDDEKIHNLDGNRYVYIRVPISSLTADCQDSLKHDRTINVIHCLANGGTEKCPYAVDGDYIIVKCTSFSYYVFTTEDVDESVKNATLDCVFDGHQFKYVYNNDATTDKDGTETEVCDHCGAKGNTRTAAGTKLESEYNLPTSFNARTADYKTYVTVCVTLKDVPSGAKVYIDGKEAAVNGKTYSADIGQVKDNTDVKLEVKLDGKTLDSATLKIEVNTGFFAKLLSVFINFIFNWFKWNRLTINF